MVGGGATVFMLVYIFDAYFAEITIGVPAGVTERGIVNVGSIAKIEILGFPEIKDLRDGDPGGFEVSVGAGREVDGVGNGDGRGVSQVGLKSVIGDTFIGG